MITKTAFIGAVLAAVLLLANEAQAVEPLSTPELAEHCIHYYEDADSKDAIFCVRYVQGFIDGAVAIDERVMLKPLPSEGTPVFRCYLVSIVGSCN